MNHPIMMQLYAQSFLDGTAPAYEVDFRTTKPWIRHTDKGDVPCEDHKLIVPVATATHAPVPPDVESLCATFKTKEMREVADTLKEENKVVKLSKKAEQETAEKSTHQAFRIFPYKCSKPGCVAHFKSEQRKEYHEKFGKCYVNGDGLRTPHRIIAPTVHGGKSDRDMAIDIMNNMEVRPSYLTKSLGECCLSEDINKFYVGIGLYKKLLRPSIPEDMHTALKELFAYGGSKEKLSAATAHRYISDSGLSYLTKLYPDIDYFKQKELLTGGNCREFLALELPDMYQVKQVFSQYLREKTKLAEAATYTYIDEDKLGAVFNDILTKGLKVKDNLKLPISDVVGELVHRGVGTKLYPLQRLGVRQLTNLPLCKENKWSGIFQKELVTLLKKSSEEINEINKTTFSLPAFLYSKPKVHHSKRGCRRHLETQDRNHDLEHPFDETSPNDLLANFPDVLDEGDSLRESPPDMTCDTELKKYDEAMSALDPYRYPEIWEAQQKIGKVFLEEGKRCKVTNVVVYRQDPAKWLFFEFFFLQKKFKDRPPTERKHMQCIRVCQFEGGEYHIQDDLIWEREG